MKFEPTGLIGTGDSHAVQELTKMFAELDADFSMSYADALSEGESQRNLILLGSEDVNVLVERVQERMHWNLQISSSSPKSTIGDPQPTDPNYRPTLRLTDSITGRTYVPSWEQRRDGSGGDQIVVDYGMVVRAPNPFNTCKTAIIIAGVYGYGTWAGVRLIAERSFHDRCTKLAAPSLECLYRVDVLNDRIIGLHVLELRPLPGDWHESATIDLRVDPRAANDDLHEQ